jgi:hypothetical protein
MLLTLGPTPLAQKILKFEGSFGEILSIFPLSLLHYQNDL